MIYRRHIMFVMVYDNRARICLVVFVCRYGDRVREYQARSVVRFVSVDSILVALFITALHRHRPCQDRRCCGRRRRQCGLINVSTAIWRLHYARKRTIAAIIAANGMRFFSGRLDQSPIVIIVF